MELNIHNVRGIKVEGYNVFNDFVSRRIIIETEETNWGKLDKNGNHIKHKVEITISLISRKENEEEGIADLKITKTEKKYMHK